MTSSANPGPAGRPSHHRPAPDPDTMTPGEKVMAEWEARHDVAARGSRATPGAIQLYLAESRLRELRKEEEKRRVDRETARRSARRPVSEDHWWYLRLK